MTVIITRTEVEGYRPCAMELSCLYCCLESIRSRLCRARKRTVNTTLSWLTYERMIHQHGC